MALILETGDENAGQIISIPVPGRSTPLVVTPVTGGGGGGGVPLSNVFYVDGGTTVAPADQDGSIGAPFGTMTAALAFLGTTVLPQAILLVTPFDYSGEDPLVVAPFSGTLQITGLEESPPGQNQTFFPELTGDVLYLSNLTFGGGEVTAGAFFAEGCIFGGNVTLAGSCHARRCTFDEVLSVAGIVCVLDECDVTELDAATTPLDAHRSGLGVVTCTTILANECTLNNTVTAESIALDLCTFTAEITVTLSVLLGSIIENTTFTTNGITLIFDDGVGGEGTLRIDHASLSSWLEQAGGLAITLGGLDVTDGPSDIQRWGTNNISQNEFPEPWDQGNASSGSPSERWQGVSTLRVVTSIRVQLQAAQPVAITYTLLMGATLGTVAATAIVVTVPIGQTFALFELTTELVVASPGDFLIPQLTSADAYATPTEIAIAVD